MVVLSGVVHFLAAGEVDEVEGMIEPSKRPRYFRLETGLGRVSLIPADEWQWLAGKETGEAPCPWTIPIRAGPARRNSE